MACDLITLHTFHSSMQVTLVYVTTNNLSLECAHSNTNVLHGIDTTMVTMPIYRNKVHGSALKNKNTYTWLCSKQLWQYCFIRSTNMEIKRMTMSLYNDFPPNKAIEVQTT